MTDTILEGFSGNQRLRGFSEKTVKRRLTSLRQLEHELSPRSLFECTTDDLEVWLVRFKSAQTRHSYRGDVAALFRWARRRGLVDYDPTERVERIRVPQSIPHPLPAAEVRRLVSMTRGDARRAVMLAAYAGLRVSEIAKLDSGDIFGEVDESGRLVSGMLVVRGGKGGKDRKVPIAPELVVELAGIVGPIVRTMSGNNVSTLIRTAMRRAGINAQPRHLRTSFGTEVAKVSNGNVVLVQELLGHSRPETTMRYIGWHPDGTEAIMRLYRPAEGRSTVA